MTLPGMWEFPGGKVESGESHQDALTREIQEELLCTIDVGENVVSTEHTYEFGAVALSTYYATIVKGVPRATEHSELRWVPLTELQDLDWAPADIPAVNRILRDHHSDR